MYNKLVEYICRECGEEFQISSISTIECVKCKSTNVTKLSEMKIGDSITGYKSPYEEDFKKAHKVFVDELPFNYNGATGKLHVFEARFIGDGTCDIEFESKKVIRVVLENGNFNYETSEVLSQEFKEYFNNKLQRVYDLKKIKDEILKKCL
jgi:DNA-directed RNA polymerase subunit RPC12/RpoP